MNSNRILIQFLMYIAWAIIECWYIEHRYYVRMYGAQCSVLRQFKIKLKIFLMKSTSVAKPIWPWSGWVILLDSIPLNAWFHAKIYFESSKHAFSFHYVVERKYLQLYWKSSHHTVEDFNWMLHMYYVHSTYTHETR